MITYNIYVYIQALTNLHTNQEVPIVIDLSLVLHVVCLAIFDQI